MSREPPVATAARTGTFAAARRWLKLDLAVIGLAASLLIALLLRLYGIHWGLPDASHLTYSYHPDEVPHLAAARVLVAGILLEKHFQYGGTLYYSILNAYFYFAGLLSDELVQVNRLADTLLLGRYVLVGIALITIVLVYQTGQRLFGRSVGAIAAFLLAINPAHIVWAQRVRPDEIAAMVSVLLVFIASLILRADSRRDLRYFVYAGLTLGVAIALRLPLVLFGLTPIMAYLLRDRARGVRQALVRLWDRRMLLMVAAGSVAYAVASPHSIIYADYVVAGMRVLWRYEAGAFPDAVDMGPGLYQYGWLMMRQALGVPFYALAVGGVVLAAVRRTPSHLLLLGAIIPYFVLTTFASWVVVRYVLPIVPLLLLAAACLIVWALERLIRHRAAVVGVTCGAVLWTLTADIAYLRVEAGENVQDAASRWINDNVPKGASILTVMRYAEDYYFNPPIPDGYPHYKVLLRKPLDSAKFLQAKKSDYLVLHEMLYKSMERLGARHPATEVYEFGRALRASRYRLIKEFKQPVAFFGVDFSDSFSSHDYSIVNPGIRIYRYEK